VEHCEREHRLVTSERLLGELEEKLRGKFRVPADRVAAVVTLLRSSCEVVTPRKPRRPVCRDPDDDWVLATAHAGECECLVTGDGDLLELVSYRGIPILSPRDFWSREASGRGSEEGRS
jgi:putative PIN family toxin of toxin-antitoxin system